jgi:hypothetical protein
VKIKTPDTCCEQVGRRGKDYETKLLVVPCDIFVYISQYSMEQIPTCEANSCFAAQYSLSFMKDGVYDLAHKKQK